MLGLKSPQFEYEYTPALKPEQKEFPKKAQPFDLYLDMYRDPKEVEAELLEERLKRAQLDDFQVGHGFVVIICSSQWDTDPCIVARPWFSQDNPLISIS